MESLEARAGVELTYTDGNPVHNRFATAPWNNR